MRPLVSQALGPAIGAVLLVGLVLGNSLHRTPLDAADYHARVQAAVRDVPVVLGRWFGRAVPIPTGVTEALQPNALLSRVYTHPGTGEQVTVLLVHCRDARDLQGHHPTICYPVNGWELARRDEAETVVAGVPTRRAVYSFRRGHVAASELLVVHSLFILPDGAFGQDLAAVDRIAGDHRYRHMGAAQLQILTPAAWDAAAQQELCDAVIDHLRPALVAIRSGGGDP